MANKAFIIIRYFITIMAVIGLSIGPLEPMNVVPIILTLLFIINTQIRFFQFRDKFVPTFISILLDFFLGYILYYFYGSLILPYFIIGIVDGMFFLENNTKYIPPILGLLVTLYISNSLGEELLIIYLITIVSLSLVSLIVVNEQSRKLKAEDLYIKLRKSEEELMKSNRDLQIYADSIKELSILQERNRISREIHDSVGHSLSTIIIQLAAIETIAKTDGESASLMAGNLRSFSKNGLEEIRKALKELKPKDFKEYETLLKIENLIEDFTTLTGINVNLGFSKNTWLVDEKTSLVLYRAIQEFLSNSAKHSNSTKINIFVHFNDNELIVTMQDNGIGTDNIVAGMGLNNIKERIEEIGGNLAYNSKKNKGFSMRIVLNFINKGMVYHNEKD